MFNINRLTVLDEPEVREFWAAHWGTDTMVLRGRVLKPSNVISFAALDGKEWVGLITLLIESGTCEIVSLDSLKGGQGIGAALMKAAEAAARNAGCTMLKVTSTPDNKAALSFYEKAGYAHLGVNTQAAAMPIDEGADGQHGVEIELGLDLKGA